MVETHEPREEAGRDHHRRRPQRARRRLLSRPRRALRAGARARDLVGGACVTEETFPGFKVSTAAYVNSLFRPEIVRDLDLGRHGFEVLPRNPSSFTPFPDGRSLMLGPDPALNEREIAKFSARDAERYPEYEAMLERVAALVEPTITMTPPDLRGRASAGSCACSRSGGHSAGSGRGRRRPSRS